ncbi:hypothetical protein [Rhodoplanes elegans]|nr:hypothetical protein [Rhodoplanes elegans]
MEPALDASGSATFDRRILVALAILAAVVSGGFLWLFNFTDFF